MIEEKISDIWSKVLFAISSEIEELVDEQTVCDYWMRPWEKIREQIEINVDTQVSEWCSRQLRIKSNLVLL